MELPLENKLNLPSLKTIANIAQSVSVSVRRFTAAGERIGDKNADIRAEMFEACKEARNAGVSLEHLFTVLPNDANEFDFVKVSSNFRNSVKHANQSLIGSLTRVLLLTDIIVVKQLLLSKEKVSQSLDRLDSVIHFAEFVKAFSVFGCEMIEFSNFLGDHSSKFKREKRATQIIISKKVIEHAIPLLLTSSKVCLMHSGCKISKESRDTVFCQIRRAMDLIHFVVKDGAMDNTNHIITATETPKHLWTSSKNTLYFALTDFSRLMIIYKQTNPRIKQKKSIQDEISDNFQHPTLNPSNNELKSDLYQSDSMKSRTNYYTSPRYQTDNFKLNSISKELLIAMDNITERVEDFANSAYINQDTREKITLLCEKSKLELNLFLRRNTNFDDRIPKSCQLNYIWKIDEISESVTAALSDLVYQIITSTLDQMFDLKHSIQMTLELLASCRSYAVNQEFNNLCENICYFHNYCEHILDVCKLFQHITSKESHQVEIQFLESNVRVFGAQVINATRILFLYPLSKACHENFEAFVVVWRWISNDVITLCEEIIDFTQTQKSSNFFEDCNLSSLWSHHESRKESKYLMENENKADSADSGPYLPTKECSLPVDKRPDQWNNEIYENNDIVKRAKNMSSMAFLMFQFTSGCGALRTTQDLFTQAEHFAEEANRLYKVVRQFSYQVPAGSYKKDLLSHLDKVPTYVQALQFIVKDNTVGKAATFVKVDQVIRETRNLMNSINKVTSACFDCASKYKLDVNELAGRPPCGYSRDEDGGTVALSEQKGSTNIAEGSM